LRGQGRPQEASKVLDEMSQVWRDMAESLARSHRGKDLDAKLNQIVEFFHHALREGLLSREPLRTDALYQELRGRPQFAQLLRD
jgi:hypothetical protein